jgi:hypothetical protein
MKKNKLFVLMVIIGVLLIVYLGISGIQNYQERKKEKADEAAQIQLVSGDALSEISYSNGAESMSFVKENDSWYYDADHEIPIKQSSLESLESSLTGLAAVRELEDPDALSDYGLTSPQYEISFTDSDGASHTLHIGDAAEDNYYASLDEESQVYTITSDLADSLSFDLSTLVENDSVPHIGSSNLKRVDVTKGEESRSYVDSDSLTELAGGFGAFKLSSPVDYHVTEETLADYGLDEENRTTVVASYEESADDASSSQSEDTSDSSDEASDSEESDDSAEKTFTVYLGKETEDDYRYVMVDGSKMVYKVSTAVINNMIYTESDSESS